MRDLDKHRIRDIGNAFRSGVLLAFVAAGIFGCGPHDLQEARVLPGLNTLAFDLSCAGQARGRPHLHPGSRQGAPVISTNTRAARAAERMTQGLEAKPDGAVGGLPEAARRTRARHWTSPRRR